MTDVPIGDRTREHGSYTAWLLDCMYEWMRRNDEDPYAYPAYPWREWYDGGLTVSQAIARANVLLFGREQGC